MAYEVVTYPAVVLRAYESGEVGMYYHLFVRGIGRIDAAATGIRKMSSKLRYALQEYSVVYVSLIHGKNSWKVVNALPSENLFLRDVSKGAKQAYVHAVSLIDRLVHGEEGDVLVFDTFLSLVQVLKENNPSVDDARLLYLIFAVKVLYRLGYVPHTSETQTIVMEDLSISSAQKLEDRKATVSRLVRKSVEASHM